MRRLRPLSRIPQIRFLLVAIAYLTIVPPVTAEDTKPNVLFVISDDLNNDLGCYGHPLVKSPNIDRLAQEGIRFDLAYCQGPLCNPSRSSFMTSLYPLQTGVLRNKKNFRDRYPDVVTLPQLFQKHGYHVARIGKVYHYGVPGQIGTDGADDPPSWHEKFNPRGIDREVHDQIHTLRKGVYGSALSWLNLPSEDLQHTDGIGATMAIEQLKKNHPAKTGKPFFLAVGFYRPHAPFVAPSKYFDLYPPEKITPAMEKPGERDDMPIAAMHDRPNQQDLSIEKRREIIQAYYASVTYMDAQLGRVLDAMEDLELQNNTIIVFLSDHGYHLGRHGLWRKGDLFDEAVRLPLVIVTPDRKNAGKSTSAITELVDLYPTLAELCGLPLPDHLMGKSLVPVLNDPQSPHRSAAWSVSPSGAGVLHKELRGRKILGSSIRTPRYRYTEWNGGEDGVELYDYQEDPDEYVNLAQAPGNEITVAKMAKLLDQVEQKVTPREIRRGKSRGTR